MIRMNKDDRKFLGICLKNIQDELNQIKRLLKQWVWFRYNNSPIERKLG